MKSASVSGNRRNSFWFLVIICSFVLALYNLSSTHQFNLAIEEVTQPLPTEKALSKVLQKPVIQCPDGVAWVTTSQASKEQGRIRLVRHTAIDNYPYGRPVMWASLHSWWLRCLGAIHEQWADSSENSIAHASAYSNAAYLVLFSIPITLLALFTLGKRGSLVFPLFVLFALVSERYPVRSPDHHMLHICLTILYLLSFSSLQNATKQIRYLNKWVMTGFWLGLLFWVSPISAVVITIATILPSPMLFKDEDRIPTLKDWFTWGGTTSTVILLSYMLDYLPDLKIHMECSNPIYAIYLLAGTPLIERWVRMFHQRLPFKEAFTKYHTVPVLIVSATTVLVLLNLNQWYTPSNEFLARWMATVRESQPSNFTRIFFLTPTNAVLFFTVFLQLIICVTSEELNTPKRRLLQFVSLGTGIIILFTLAQTRMIDFLWPFLAVSVGVTICRKQLVWHDALLISISAIMLINHYSITNIRTRNLNLFHDKSYLHTALTLSHNIQLEAQEIIETCPEITGSILTDPGTSIFLNYYLGTPVYGTFYWENYTGMLRASKMLYQVIDFETQTFPNIKRSLDAENVNFIYYGNRNLASRLPYALHGSIGMKIPRDRFFYPRLSKISEADLPPGVRLLKNTNKGKLLKIESVPKTGTSKPLPALNSPQ